MDGPPSSRGQAAGDHQFDPGPTEIPAAGDCQLDLASRPGGIPAAEGRALPSLPAVESGVPMGLNLQQMAFSQNRDLVSDPLGLTFHPGPRH